MDTTIIFTLVLSTFFLGGILWLVIHSRRRQRAVGRPQHPTPVGKNVSRTRAAGGKKNG